MNLALLLAMFQSGILCLACSEFMHSVLAGPSCFLKDAQNRYSFIPHKRL